MIRDILEAWGEDEAGKYLVEAYEKSNSAFVLADVYVDRGRELGVFASEGYDRPVITGEDFEKLGAILLSKILAAVEDGSLSNAPFYWDIINSWQHLADGEAPQEWVRERAEESGSFTVKVARGMVMQSVGSSGRIYEYRKRAKEDPNEAKVVYENAQRHLIEAKDLTDDDRSVLHAVITGMDRVNAGKAPDTSAGGDE